MTAPFFEDFTEKQKKRNDKALCKSGHFLHKIALSKHTSLTEIVIK